MDLQHPSGLNPRVVAKVSARRGRLHAYESLVPAGGLGGSGER